ncbi:uncharacterized protein LOC121732932 [Aricia agestis]|uniref:uncharacterized protein LOC121732932 n=1 Tax=Aricia agestis TaxID=91739 RepID=UPI001C201988|nr:uncharacterized protein LOC121732932 [Aricia agestis]
MNYNELEPDFYNSDTISISTLALEEDLKQERTQEISELVDLSKKVSFLHTSLLYYRNAKSNMGTICYDAWKMVVKKVGGAPNTWQDFGCYLGISQEDLDYITNSIKDDPADLILKVFMQNENATIDKIVDALLKMKRYDILKSIEVPLCNLVQCFNKDDSGYHSGSKNSGSREVVSFTKNLKCDLPLALKKKLTKDDKKPNTPSIRPPLKTVPEKQADDTVMLFLTYAEDGLDTALNIQQYVDNWDSPRVTILMLNDRREEVYQNPEKFIRENFEKADFIVPIITTGYINRINSNTPQTPCTTDNLDYKYVNFIYNLIINHYIYVTGCLNEKARSVLPHNAHANVLSEVASYPALLPWTYETYFDEMFKAFLKKDSY